MRTFKGQERPTKKELREAFAPYAESIGYLVYAWNELHDRLCQMFQIMVQSPSPQLAGAVWHSTDSDYAQRKMLRAAVEKTTRVNKSQRGDILWALNKIDATLRHGRNDAIHAPLAIYHAMAGDGSFTLKIDPNYFSDSPKVWSLHGKDIRHEFDELAELADVLSGYVGDMGVAIFQPGISPWPGRPPLPRAHRTKNHKGSNPQSSAK
jgi:hypothetical protein